MLGGLKEVVVGYWLKEIVKGADLEPLDSILAESCREDDSSAFRKHPGKLHPAESWHLNVAEQEINRFVLDELESGRGARKCPFKLQKGSLLNI